MFEEEMSLEEARIILHNADYPLDVIADEQRVCVQGDYSARELKAMLVLLSNNEDF